MGLLKALRIILRTRLLCPLRLLLGDVGGYARCVARTLLMMVQCSDEGAKLQAALVMAAGLASAVYAAMLAELLGVNQMTAARIASRKAVEALNEILSMLSETEATCRLYT